MSEPHPADQRSEEAPISAGSEPPQAVLAWADEQRARGAAPCVELEGDLLLPPTSETPPVCLKCGAHENLVPRRYFARARVWFGKLSVVVALFVYLLVRWRFVRLSLCAACDARRRAKARRNYSIAAGLFVGAGLVLALLVEPLKASTNPYAKMLAFVPQALAVIAFYASLYFLVSGGGALGLWASADWKRRVRVFGVDPSVRAAIVDLSAQAASGGAEAIRTCAIRFPLRRSEADDVSAIEVERASRDG